MSLPFLTWRRTVQRRAASDTHAVTACHDREGRRYAWQLALYGKECVVCEGDQSRVTELGKVILESLQVVVEAAPSCDHHGD
jgi:hypothetical protein